MGSPPEPPGHCRLNWRGAGWQESRPFLRVPTVGWVAADTCIPKPGMQRASCSIMGLHSCICWMQARALDVLPLKFVRKLGSYRAAPILRATPLEDSYMMGKQTL